MEFNSFQFLIFFLVFLILYWFVFNKSGKNQNILLFLGSCVFYSWWDWRFLFLLLGTSLFNFILGIYIAKTTNEKKRNLLFYVALFQGIGMLFFFKYFNFFTASLISNLSAFNIGVSNLTLNLILPLGISFFTFKTISYCIDVDNEKIEPTKDWLVFFNYVTFFPTLLAGPIDKASFFIPQLVVKRELKYENGIDALRQILWGLFKKIVIANNCALLVNEVFGNYQNLTASTLLIGAFFNVIQVYADFSGYSDMAIGISKLLGFNVTKNFNYPFFAQNIAQFWQRWHISLTSWMTEYLYTPLSFILRDYKKNGMILAIVINFILVGLWHGANWTYILFGFLHGLYFIPLILNGTINKRPTVNENKKVTPKIIGAILQTFLIVMLTGVIFTTTTVTDAFQYYKKLISPSILTIPTVLLGTFFMIKLFSLTFFMIFIEWLERNQDFTLKQFLIKKPKFIRFGFYYMLMILILIYMNNEQKFVYFQF